MKKKCKSEGTKETPLAELRYMAHKLDEQGSTDSTGNSGSLILIPILLFTILLIIFVFSSLLVNYSQKRKRELKSISTEQIQNIQVGDFIRFSGLWYPVKQAFNDSEPVIQIKFYDGKLLSIENNTYRDCIDSVVYRKTNSAIWDSLALEYCISH
jgi:preprotein translocase subunit YajC